MGAPVRIPSVLGAPLRFGSAHAAAFRAVARRESESGRHAEAVDVLRVVAFLRPDQAQSWDELARALGRVGDAAGCAAAAKIARTVRESEVGR
jgi:predicted Zn-dependent protease